MNVPSVSQRIINTDVPHIEIVLNRYAHLDPPPANLAQGVSRWNPPPSVFRAASDGSLSETRTHKYNAVLGLADLRDALHSKLEQDCGLDMTGQEIMVCAGANQAFVNAALALLDPGDKVVLPRPYYFSHLCSLQLAGACVEYCDFNKATLLPDMAQLRQLLRQPEVKMVVITTPGNPSGAVYSRAMIEEIAQLCREHGTWLVIDEAYCDFVHDGAQHYSPCANALGFDSIIHIYSFSKSYGLAGWRVGYMVYPQRISEHIQKVQDTVPTHAAVASQRLALAALQHRDDVGAAALDGGADSSAHCSSNGHGVRASESDVAGSSSSCASTVGAGDDKGKLRDCGASTNGSSSGGSSSSSSSAWVKQQVAALHTCREAMWSQVSPYGTVRTNGAFYFFVPLPGGPASEDAAIELLAMQCGVLVTPGSAFGAPGHIRVSYGSLPEPECLEAIARLGRGLRSLAQRAENGPEG